MIVAIPSQTTMAGAAATTSFSYAGSASRMQADPFSPMLGATAFSLKLAVRSSYAGVTRLNTAAQYELASAVQVRDDLQCIGPCLTQKERDDRLAELEKHTRTLAPDRIKVIVPDLQVPLGSPFEATIQLAPGELFTPIFTMQTEPGGTLVDGAGGVANVLQEEGGVKTIEITPLELGAIDLKVSVTYNDNAEASQTLHLHVVPSAKGLKKFSLLAGLAPLHIDMVMADEERDREASLEPSLSYEGLDRSIRPTLDQLTYSVDQPEADPVIRVDKYGKIAALRTGKAVIKAEYAGITDQVTVNVYSKEDAPMNWRETHAPLK